MLDTIKQLGGFFNRGNILIGGSYVYSKELYIEWNNKDIDIFILIPRMEKWALITILETIFDELEYRGGIKKPEYMLEGQWCRVIGYKNGNVYDLIFIAETTKTELIKEKTGSTISRLYYEITFNDTEILRLHSRSLRSLKFLKTDNICYIYEDISSPEYILKIINICEILNMKVIKC